MQSWAYWQYKYFNDITTTSGPEEGFYKHDGKLDTGKVRALARTYVQAVRGTPHKQAFNPLTASFYLQYNADRPSATLPTEVYYHAPFYYPMGYKLSVQPMGFLTVNTTEHVFSVQHSSSLPANATVFVALSPIGRQNGSYTSADNDRISWSLDDSTDNSTVTLSLSTAPKLTWWKQLILRSNTGQVVCTVSTQDSNHGPKVCKAPSTGVVLPNQGTDGLSYRIELWKAKALGVHTLVDSWNAQFFGELGGRELGVTWETD